MGRHVAPWVMATRALYYSNDGGQTWCCASVSTAANLGTLIPGVTRLPVDSTMRAAIQRLLSTAVAMCTMLGLALIVHPRRIPSR